MKKRCPYCKKEIRKKDHLLKCRPDIELKESYSLLISKSYKCDVEDVLNSYINGSSLPDIKREYGLPYRTTIQLLELHGFSTRSISESSEFRIEKYRKTCKSKYGVDNPSKLDVIKEKKKKTFIENYGVDNIFKTDGFSEYVSNILLNKYGRKRVTNPKKISKKRLEFSKSKWLDIHKKTRKTIQQKYGDSCENVWNKYVSEIENKVENVLSQNSIDYQPQIFISGRSYDFRITNTNYVIEVNGDYWHGNPKYYNENETIHYAGKGMIPVKELWESDMKKINLAEKYGYKVIVLWESDILFHEKNNTLNEFILNKLIFK